MLSLKKHLHFQKIDSTNNFLLNGNYLHGTIITADSQIAGRGRKNHRWYDVAGNTFIFSLLLKYKDISKISYLSIIVGLSVVESVKEVYKQIKKKDIEIFIKWPNDILLKKNQKTGKLAGILIESRKNEDEWDLVIGIGLNWKGVIDFPDFQMRFPPVALFDFLEESPLYYLNFLIPKMNQLSLEEPYDFLSYRDMFLKYHYLLDKKVRINGTIYRVGKVSHQGFLEIINEKNQSQYIQDWEEDYELLIND